MSKLSCRGICIPALFHVCLLVLVAAAASAAGATQPDDLPIVEIPASGPADDRAVLLMTGDGGYTGLDQALAAGFAARGQPVAVLNSLKYFWKARTPQEVANDVDRMIRHYSATWHRQRIILVGYSQGADVMPFVLNRLPQATRAQVAAVALIGFSDSAVFEFHIANWLKEPKGTPTLPELSKLRGLPLTCIYGAEEKTSFCPQVPAGIVKLQRLPGGHHFDGDYQAVTQAALDATRP